jgi:hypothetical protein
MAFARGQIQDRPDYWVPILYMRLLSGQLWKAALPRRWILAGAAAMVLAAGGAWALKGPPESPDPARLEFLNLRPAALNAASPARPSYQPSAETFRESWAAGTGAMVGVTMWRMSEWDLGDNTKAARGVKVFHNSALPSPTPIARTESGQVSKELKGVRMEAGTAVDEQDMIRFTIESPRRGYLYILDRERLSSGAFREPQLLYPDSSTEPGENLLAPGRAIDYPGQLKGKGQKGVYPDYFQITRSAGVAEEVISILVSPVELPRDFKPKLEDFAGWVARSQPQRRDLAGGVGQVWTVEEQLAGSNPEVRLNQSDPLPQTLFRFRPQLKDAVLIDLPIPLKPIR